MKRYELKKIDILSAAKLYLVFGLIMGLFAGIGFIMRLSPLNPQNMFLAIIGAFFAILFYALIGVAFMALGIWIYNALAKRVGGLVIYLEEETYLAPARSDTDVHDHKLT